MSVDDSQCAAYVTEFESHSVNIALLAVQGVVTSLSIIGSVLLILSYFVRAVGTGQASQAMA